MKKVITFLILCILSFNISAQEIPKNLNAYDLDSNKTGVWTILYDVDWNVTEIIDSVEFYRIITYERGVPSGKVIDYYITGEKQWEGYLLSDEPEDIYLGKCEWFNESGDVIEKRIITEQISEEFYYEKNELLLKVLVKNDTLISYDIYIKDTLSFPLYILYTLEAYDLISDNKSLDLNLECLALYEKILGKEHSDYAVSLSNIAQIYSDLGDYSKALELNLECLALREKILGKEHLYYAVALGNLSLSYSYLGDYNKALDLNLECLALYEKILGKEHSDYSVSLSNIAQIYSDLGDYSKALELNLECLDLSEKILGKEHPDYAVSLSNLTLNYSDLGDYNKALELNLECLALSEKILGKEHPDYAVSLNNLASTYSDLGNHNKALELNLECLALYEKIYGKEHPDYALSLNNLASTYSDLGNYNKALELNLKCLALSDKIYGKEHPDYALSLSNKAQTYSVLGDYSKALELNLECLALYEKILGKKHPDYAVSLSNIGYIYLNLKNYNESYSFYSQSQKLLFSRFTLDEKNLNTNLVKESYNSLFNDYQRLFNISNHLISSIKIKDQYNKLCFLKGRELSQNTSMVADIYQSDDEWLISLYDDWLSINRKIAVCYENTLEERKNLGLDIDDLQDKADDFERQLVKRSSVFASHQRNYSFNDIVSDLKSNEVYLDIVNMPTYNFDKNHLEIIDSNRYYAYVIQKGYTTPRIVYLGAASDFDSIYSYYSTYTQKRPPYKEFRDGDEENGNICYQNFWSKLEPYLEGVATVYFSPEGVYSKINPNVLYDSTVSSFLMDKYDIVYVSNVEDFVHQKENIQLYERPDDLHAIIIGNPTFLLGEDEVVLATNEYQTRAINQDGLDSLQRGYILSQLNGTQVEIDLISNNLKSKGWDVEVISGVDATETRVKSIEAPKILHIATHGFFFEDQEMVKRSNMISTDNKKVVSNPMTRSGLIFSGAENTMNGEIFADDNGWLNSYEASLLNLRGTELVVLSACETGTGDVQNGKGVYGLQRAIRVAGAESLIMSMWEVDDKATQELMTYFYDYWIDKNMTKKDAFNKAQEKIREKYKHPYYWGAFIMLGE
jgi:CHAT domain-containing protein